MYRHSNRGPAPRGTAPYLIDAALAATITGLYDVVVAIAAGICVALMRPLMDMANQCLAYRIHCHYGLVMKLQLATEQDKHEALLRTAAALGVHVVFARLALVQTWGQAASLTGVVLGIAAGGFVAAHTLLIYLAIRRRASTVHGPTRIPRR